MKKWRKLSVTILFVIVLICFYKLYKKIEAVPNIYISSIMLTESFSENEILAYKKYVGKVIDTEGIKKISFKNNRNTLLLEGNQINSGVLCDIETIDSIEFKRLVVGQKIRVKGTCKGFLKDVILLNCVLIDIEDDL